MPQMGESITEGTVSKWLKSVGDEIEKDEPLLEISTDKVDAEVPSPAGRNAARDQCEGRRDGRGRLRSRTGRCGRRCGHSRAASRSGPELCGPERCRTTCRAAKLRRRRAASAQATAAAAPAANGGPTANRPSTSFAGQNRSPLVRNIAKEHGIDITRIPGSGHQRPRDKTRHSVLYRDRCRSSSAGPARKGSTAFTPAPAIQPAKPRFVTRRRRHDIDRRTASRKCR